MDEELTPEVEESFDLPESEELDQYGVWVKSDPEDLTDVAEPDPVSPGLDEVEESSGFLTDEEEDLLGDLERRDSADTDVSAGHQEAEDEVMSINEPEDLKAESPDNDEFSIEIDDLGDSGSTDFDGSDLDSDALQNELDSIDLDNLDDSDPVSLDFTTSDDEEDHFLEEEEMHLDLDSDVEEVDLSKQIEEDEEAELDDLQIPGLDELDNLGESEDSGSSSNSQDEPAGAGAFDEASAQAGTDDDLELPDFSSVDDELAGLGAAESTSSTADAARSGSAPFEPVEIDIEQIEDVRDELEVDLAGDDTAEAAGAQSPEAQDEIESSVQIPDLEDEFLDIGDDSLESDSLPGLEETSLPSLEDDIEEGSSDYSLEASIDDSIDEMEALTNLREETDFSTDDVDALPGTVDDGPTLDEIDEPDFNETLPELGDFDDVDALTRELSSDTEIEPDDEPQISVLGTPTADGDSDRSEKVKVEAGSSILSAIESELSAIRNELTSLRSELKSLRSGAAALPDSSKSAESDFDDDASYGSGTDTGLHDDADFDFETPASPSGDSAEEEPDHSGGFFDDEEDETIALTGDELDNILNTAEFTEEAGKPTEIEEDAFEPEETLAQDEVDFGQSATGGYEDSVVDGDLDGEEAVQSADQEPSPEVDEIALEEIAPQDAGLMEHDPFQGSEAEVQAMAELDIEKELAGIDDLEDDSLQVDFDESELEKMSIDIPDSFAEEESPIRELPDGFEPDLSAEESELLQDSIDDDYERSFPEDNELGPLADEEEVAVAAPVAAPAPIADDNDDSQVSDSLKNEIKSVLAYMDKLLEALPEEKIEEFARSEHFEVYKRLFEELGL